MTQPTHITEASATPARPSRLMAQCGLLLVVLMLVVCFGVLVTTSRGTVIGPDAQNQPISSPIAVSAQ